MRSFESDQNFESAPSRIVSASLEDNSCFKSLAASIRILDFLKSLRGLNQSDLRQFFKRCGTHYVRGGIHRRGLLINLDKNG